MALAVYDRVRETTAVVGTNDAVLLGAVTGFQSFAVVGTTNTCYYTIADQSGNWEVGLGTYNSVGPTMERTTVLSSSAGGAKVNFPVGTKDIFLTYPAEVAVLSSNNPSTAGYVLTSNGAGVAPSWQINAGGDVTGPASATDTAVALFDGTTGKLIKNSGVTIDGSNNVSGVAQLNATTADLTNLEVTNIKAKDGTAAISIADTTGVVTGSTPQVISVNSSSNALRITQTGSGNALVVEDSANPDISPFVVDTAGKVGIGLQPNIDTAILQVAGGGVTFATFTNNAFVSTVQAKKSRSTTVGTYTVVQNGDELGSYTFWGDDGTQFIRGAQINAQVDGTPGTNDMPGRLIFSTTADGASSPTERMRIDSYGSVGVGGTAGAPYTLYLLKNPTGATATYGLRNGGTIQSDVTLQHNVFFSRPATAASAFTMSGLYHYRATQGTFGAGSAVTSQHGFMVDSDLTGATNNYGFYSNIASGTGRWNFYAAGSAANYFAGDMQFAKTVTAAGTTGARTINKTAGTVNFAAADTSLVVTNSLVTANSIIVCTVGTDDSTMKSVSAVAGAGSFTLYANAAATAETRVNFIVIN